MDQIDVENEKRRSPRRKVRLRSGILRKTDGKQLTDCLIYDLSRTGARIVLHEMQLLPTTLLLEDQTDGTLRAVRIVYFHVDGIGIEFIDPDLAATPATD